jgi:hypothetical protein
MEIKYLFPNLEDAEINISPITNKNSKEEENNRIEMLSNVF